MTYELFKNRVISGLEQIVEAPREISVCPVHKNNGLSYDALIIMHPACNIAPTIYLDPYYQDYKSGSSIDAVCEEILRSYETNRPCESVDLSFFTDFEHAGANIVYKLIHYEKNKNLLEQVPHIRYLDLAIVFICMIRMDGVYGNASILIRHTHLDMWQISRDELIEKACRNTPRLLPAQLQNIRDVLTPLFDEMEVRDPLLPLPSDSDDPIPMLVLTNSSGVNGAACILYPRLLEQYAAQWNSDFYLLPSSIHEFILVPTRNRRLFSDLSCMVCEVNQTQLAPDEILSDHVYYYSREEDLVSMV